MTFTHRACTDGDRISVINRPEMPLFDSYRRILQLYSEQRSSSSVSVAVVSVMNSGFLRSASARL
jgi:hypothetical protein